MATEEGWAWLIGVVAATPLGATVLRHVWELSIRPRLIPADEIAALADEMIARYGPRTEEIAFMEEDRAWRYAATFQQGRWHRVRRGLWRRHEAGEWGGPDG